MRVRLHANIPCIPVYPDDQKKKISFFEKFWKIFKVVKINSASVQRGIGFRQLVGENSIRPG